MSAILALSFFFPQEDIASRIETAIQGQHFSGSSFHTALKRALAPLGEGELRHTLGDGRGVLITTSGEKDKQGHSRTLQIFLWPEGSKNRAQVIKQFVDVPPLEGGPIDSYTEGDIYWKNDRLVIAGINVDGGLHEPSSLTSYRLRRGQWELVQHLIGHAEGHASFAKKGRSVTPNLLTFMSGGYPRYIKESHVGPHILYRETWRLRGDKYMASRKIIDTPLAELDRLAAYVARRDHRSFDRFVMPSLRAQLWAGIEYRMRDESVDSNLDDNATTLRMDSAGSTIEFKRKNGRWAPFRWAPGGA